MTEALATLFEGKEVRVVEHGGMPWFPLTDLAAVWGVDQSAPYHIVERNPEVFDGLSRMSCDLDVTATSGRCVNERGLYLLMGKISAGRLKNPEAKAAIIRFQRWVPELIQRYRKKEIIQVQQGPVLETELTQAKRISELTGTDLRTMRAQGIRRRPHSIVAARRGRHLVEPHADRQPLRSFRPGGQQLDWNRFQYRGPDGLWRLTDKGEMHGEEYWIETTTRHREIRIRWKESILTASGLIREPVETLARV